MARDVADKAESKPSATSLYDPYTLPDFDTEFISNEDLEAFANALAAPTTSPVTALNDWKPINQKIKKSGRRKASRRSKDETREGFVYSILYWPLLFFVMGWVIVLFIAYNLTRFYIYVYEHAFSWAGRREALRRKLWQATSYDEWKEAAQALDKYLGNDDWKRADDYSYYNCQTVRKVIAQLSILQERVDKEERQDADMVGGLRAIDEMKTLLEGCIKNNFMGVENPHLYSETYIGTKDLVQTFIDSIELGLKSVLQSKQISEKDKGDFFRLLELNYGRTALCLSGGACLAYYHFGVLKALLDDGNLPEIITGTSGGALIAALVGTRTDEELKQLLKPALAYRIRACQEAFPKWVMRWWRTGARFDSIDWARQSSWFCRGSLTFREAYERTGRILNVTCVPSDPYSPTLLNNHITSPDCVIWSAVLASAAVPGILNPIVLMRKTKEGKLVPYSFGNKWKDGSLRTDIPLKSLNIHFNVNFSVVSQTNPHVYFFFFSPRGSPGKPVVHRKGRGWRGGFLGSSVETAIKLDLMKYLKILRHLELLPRFLGQDWSEVFLQKFSGTITIWPKSTLGDLWNILSDPSPQELARKLRVGEKSIWPRLRFIGNRLKIENVILEGLRASKPVVNGTSTPSYTHEQQQRESELGNVTGGGDSEHLSPDELRHLLMRNARRKSSLLQEIGRQAAVLWHDGDPTDVDEEGVTTASEDEDNTPYLALN